MKSLIALSHVMLDDIGHGCGVSTQRDHKTITLRIEHEGLSFLTITLAQFAKDFDRSLAAGRVDSSQFVGFRRSGGLPAFLQGFLRLVFNASSGVLLDDPDVSAIRAIRQFTMAFAKVEIDCSEERVAAAIRKYIECESDVRLLHDRWRSRVSEFQHVAGVLFRDLFTEIDHRVFSGEVVPKHGPGSTAEGVVGNDKYTIQQWTQRLDRSFPVGDFAIPSSRYWRSLDALNIVEPWNETPVRVVTVPKTLKTPRIIAIEPVCMQYAQQSLMEVIVEGIEKSDFLSPFIGFSDQIPNQEMAREGSITGALATLDLSDASDRVSNQHVLHLLSRWPHLRGAVQDCRSTKADVPGYGVIRLSKFASMGSALCFPFEAMVFTTIIFASIGRQLNTPVTRKLITGLRGKVRVYGDDIIVPTQFAQGVAYDLEDFGLKVNHTKSFWSGNFRESCGGDYFRGVRVTPVRVKSVVPSNAKSAVEAVVSTVSTANLLSKEAWFGSAEWLHSRMAGILPVYPTVAETSPALGRHAHFPIPEKMCDVLHRPLVKGCVTSAPLPISRLDEHGALMKFFLRRGDEPLDVKSFMRAGRPVSVHIKTRWVPAV